MKDDFPQLRKMNEYFENTPEEVQKQHFHEIMCERYGIDPADPKSEKNLKRCLSAAKFRLKVLQHIRNVLFVILMMWMFCHAGWCFAKDYPIWFIVIDILGGLGWFYVYLRKKFFDTEIY
jgi:hypothetical protein